MDATSSNSFVVVCGRLWSGLKTERQAPVGLGDLCCCPSLDIHDTVGIMHSPGVGSFGTRTYHQLGLPGVVGFRYTVVFFFFFREVVPYRME
jgi:hypothetical protein